MDLVKAKRIEFLRCGPVMHSWRRISELICDEFPDDPEAWRDRGNQLHGVELCREAMMRLHNFEKIQDVPDVVRDKWDT